MITTGQKNSLLISSQLPEFVRDSPDYDNFVAFLTAYYEWLEQDGNVAERTKNLLNYKDIDKTSSEFLDYFIQDFLPYFPKDALISKDNAVKIAKELYSSKGTPASFKFLFRVLYDSDFDVYFTKDSVLRASDGDWYIAKSLRLATEDPRFLSIANYRMIGETSKSIAVIENSLLAGTKTEVFISNIERLFQSGEFVRIVDTNNQDVLINGEPLRAKIVGQISQVKINPNKRGLLYKPHDPVIVYDGLNPDVAVPLGAIAEVGTTTTGSIQSINVTNGGYGYRIDPNSTISIVNGGGAEAIVASIDPDVKKMANLAFISTETIDPKKFYTIGANNYHFTSFVNANANTTIANALEFASFSTYPLTSLLLLNGGGGINATPEVTATSLYENVDGGYNNLKSLGILAPIQIENGGVGYVANDKIIFTGGRGYGAHANVTSVAANGMITRVDYVYQSELYPPGGLGYSLTELPTLTVQSANVAAHGASLYVGGIIGDGATFESIVDRVGSISTINILDAGEDYVSSPSVSLKVQDIVVSNVNSTFLPEKGDIVYQGSDFETSTYTATVNNITLLTVDNDPSVSLYNLRVFEYSSRPRTTQDLKINGKNANMVLSNTAYDSTYDSNGIRTFGDGKAQANASFLNGLVISGGQYINKRGQLSSYDVLQSSTYNDYTYQITVSKEIEKYREILLNLLHPTGMQMLGRYTLDVYNNYKHSTLIQSIFQGSTLYYHTGVAAANVTMSADFTNKSSNIVKFNNIGVGANIAEFIFANSIISLGSSAGPNVFSEIVNIDYANDQIELVDSNWLTYSNVAVITGSNGSNEINITSLTNAYDIMNNGIYSDSEFPLKDIVYAGDRIKVANNDIKEVESVDYTNGVITLSTNLTSNTTGLMSVSRTFTAGGTSYKADEIKIFGPLGVVYYPQLAIETGEILTTEDGKIILLG